MGALLTSPAREGLPVGVRLDDGQLWDRHLEIAEVVPVNPNDPGGVVLYCYRDPRGIVPDFVVPARQRPCREESRELA